MKNKKCHIVGTFPKSNRKITERGQKRGKLDTPITQIDYPSLSWLGTFRESLKCINHTKDLRYHLSNITNKSARL